MKAEVWLGVLCGRLEPRLERFGGVGGAGSVGGSGGVGRVGSRLSVCGAIVGARRPATP